MDIASYAAHTDTTAIYPDAGKGSLAAVTYVSLGLLAEAAEALEKELLEDTAGLAAELGDVGWHVARLHLELGVDPAGTFRRVLDGQLPAPTSLAVLVVTASRLAGQTQKALRDDNGALSEARQAAMVHLLPDLTRAWLAGNFYHGLDASEVLAANAAKLTDRRNRGVLAGSGDTR